MLDISGVNVPIVNRLVDAAVEAVQAGAKSLVRCHMGLNRSALVAILVAILAAVELTGEDPAKRVRQPRRDRSEDVLYNETFERYVLDR
ncbi:hypothetical protein [Terrabacter carboxydivorans]|uniref:Tyrosine specific protein phosphatases domain-containing protein n=1 Tax=Terrabacter carboxydivorans TaxID=619730 RepID=A0ABN3KSS9_9MICO